MHRIMTWRPAMSGSHGLQLALDILLANVFCHTACCKQGRDKKGGQMLGCLGLQRAEGCIVWAPILID